MQNVGTVAYGNRYNVRRTTTTGRCMVNVLFFSTQIMSLQARTKGETVITADAFWVEALPLLLAGILCSLCLILSLHLWQTQRVQSPPAKGARALGERQNYVYKRAAAVLLIFGAAGGFLPSLFMLAKTGQVWSCLLYTSPSPRDYAASRMPSSA